MMSAVRIGRVRPAVPFLGAFLATVVWLSPVGKTASQASDTPALEECAQSPTVACVVALAIETAKAIDDAYERANAFVLIAEAQRVASELPGAWESLSRATAAAAAIEHLADHEKPVKARAFIDIARAQVSTPVEDSAKGRRKRLPPGLVG